MKVWEPLKITFESVSDLTSLVKLLIAVRHKWVKGQLFGRKGRVSTASLRDLRRLIRLLTKTEGWLALDESSLLGEVRREIWRLAVRLSYREYAFLAANSDLPRKEREAAILQLAGVDTPESMALLKNLSENTALPENVQAAARRALEGESS